MNRSTELISALVLILPLAACSAPPNASKKEAPRADSKTEPAVQQSGTSSFASSAGPPDCDLNVNLVNTSFRIGRIYSRKAPLRQILVRERSTQTGCTNSEGLTGTIA